MSGQKPMSELYKTLARVKKQREELNKKTAGDKLRETNPARRMIREQNYSKYVKKYGKPEWSERYKTRDQLLDDAEEMFAHDTFPKKKKK